MAPVLHKKDSAATVDKVELPQLFSTVITGLAGTGIGAATPDPAELVQPLTAWVTV